MKNKKKLKYNQNELYCLKCHDQYPNPRYVEKEDQDFDGWLFLEINKTKGAISNYANTETEMICPICKDHILIGEIDEIHNRFMDWQKDMKNGKEFEIQSQISQQNIYY
jgi:hypothetical protein